jgi:glycosyltransferase involved in cell wall biosynthesis
MKKKILVLSPCFPYPPHDGGKVRLYNIIKRLALTNQVFLLSYVESMRMNEYVPVLEELGVKVSTVTRDDRKGIMGKRLPRCISSFYTPEMIEKLEHTLAKVRPDLVQLDFLIMTQYVNHVRDIPVVYTEHDASNISFEQSFHDRDLSERMRFVEWYKLVNFEREMLPRFKAVVVLTERDKRLLDEFMPGLRMAIVPTGVDFYHFRPVPPREARTPPVLAFVGHYRHYPNFDAVYNFIRHILPKIVAVVPDVQFHVVGSGLRKDCSELNGEHVKIIGEVRDVGAHLAQADVFVAPVRLGGGIKGKVLEAMATGIPVVASREACEGISCSPGTDILVADSNDDFARRVVELLQDGALRTRLAAAARTLVEKRYDWDSIVAGLDTFYDSLLS